MPCSCVVCLLCCVLLLEHFLFRCDREDSFVYGWFGFIRLSCSWTRSSSLPDFRQDDRYPGSHYYHFYASCFVISLCCVTYLLLIKPPILPWTSNLWHLSYANRGLAMLPLCSAPLIALLVTGEVEDCPMVDRILLGYHNISYIISKGWKTRPFAWCFVPLLPP